MKYALKWVLASVLAAGFANELMPASAAINQQSSSLDARASLAVDNLAIDSERIDSEITSLDAAAASDPTAIGRSHYALGQYSDAALAWQAASEAAAAEGDMLTQAIALSYASLAYQALNQWSQAEAAVSKSLELLESLPTNTVEPGLWAQVLNTQAGLAYHLGQAESALAMWKKAEDFYQQADDQTGRLGSQINQAQALQSLGFYRRSRQQPEVISQQLSTLPDSELKVNGLRTLGTALQVLGDLTGSRAALFESANIAVDINATQELSATYLSLGRTAGDWGDHAATLTMFDEAKKAALTPTDRLQADLSRLRFFVENAETENSAQTATEIATQLEGLPPSRLTVYGTVNLTASLARGGIANGYLGQALPIESVNQLLSKAVRAAQTLNDKQAEAYALNQWGALYMQTQQWSDALILTEKSLDIARTINADDIASQSAWQLGRILKEQNKTPEAIEAYSEAVDSLQALRSDLVAIDPDVQFSFRENVEPIYRELVSLLLVADSDATGAKSNAQPSQKTLAKAREVVEALQLAELDNFFQEACIDVESEQIDQVDTGATVIYPIILPDRLAVIASTSGQPLEYYSTPVSLETVEATLQELLSTLHPVSDNSHRLELSQQVYDWLVRPAEDSQLTANTETMVFVLDGMLRNVPMAALHDGDQYLIEKYAVALSPGLQLMSARSLNQISTDAVVGGISEARNGLSALPAVEAEINDISNLISADTLFNEEFTSEGLARNVKNSSANIVHLATHGQFSSRLEDTFLSTWEGRLSVKELSEILKARGQSSAIELLVLSACDTASGDDRAVLGLAGLAVQSGARSTVATLWPVKDQAAATLMKVLYEGIGDETGMSKAEALRQAQLALLEDPTYSDPFFWAAYTLVGNWQ